MSYYPRTLENAINSLSLQFPALLLSGSRQTGKTTLLKALSASNRKYVTLDDLSLRELARHDPKLFLQQFEPPLFIDEIQYAPELFPYLKMRIDEQRENGLFWLSGSQQFQMMQRITETLAGRIAILTLSGFSQAEFYQQATTSLPFLPSFELLRKKSVTRYTPETLFQYLWQGSMPIPAVYPQTDWHVFYNSYLQTYLQRDIRELSQVANLSVFTRFIRVCAARTGQILNYSDLARDTDISQQTAKNWLSLLESCSLVYLLPPWHSNTTKRLIKTPKIYFLDTGLCAFLTHWTSSETLQHGAMNGAIFETFVVGEILKSYWYNAQNPNFFYYRDKDGKEIDLLIEQNNRLFPIEIKLAATVKKEWVRNFSVLDRFSQARDVGVVICLSPEPQIIDNQNLAIPITLL